MAAIERMLNIKIIQTGGLKEVLEWGITEDDFPKGSEDQAIFHMLVTNYMSPESPGTIMGPHMVHLQLPNLNLADIDPYVTLDHLCNELRKDRIASLVMEKVKIITETAAAGMPYEAAALVNELQYEIGQLQLGRSTDVSFQRGIAKVKERYLKMKAGDSVGVMSWPWPPLQEQTKGVQEDDYIVLYGRPKSMKTWILVFLIFCAIMEGKRVLFYTKEMTDTNLYMRLAACFLQVHYTDMRLGKMTPEKEQEFALLEQCANEISQEQGIMCLSAQDAGGRDSVAWLESKVKKYKPDIVFIDGIYLMSVDKKTLKDNERVQLISRQIRQMILNTRIPVIATIQANRKAEGHAEANLDEIAFSDALSQDCTIAARVIKSKDESPQTISIVLGGLREFSLVGFKVHGIPCVDFSFHSSLTQEQADKEARTEQQSNEEGEKTDAPKRGKNGGKKNGGPKPMATVPTRLHEIAPARVGDRSFRVEEMERARQQDG